MEKTPTLHRDSFREEEIKSIIAELEPVIKALDDLKDKYGIANETISIYDWLDGDVSIGGDGLKGWTVLRKKNGTTRIEYKYENIYGKEETE